MLNKHEAKHYNGNSKFNMLNKLLAFVVVSVILLINTTSGILSYLTAKTSITNVFTLARTYTVEFNANGGTGTMPDQEIPINTYTNLDTNLFTRQDFVFTEWNTQPDGSGTSYDDGESVIDITAEDATITLYAQWEELLGVAEVNGQYFDSLQAAINAVTTSTKTTVRLLANVTEDITISSTQNILFNLQNYTITGTTDASKATIENNGILEIQNGTVTKLPSTAHAVINNNAGATLKVTGGSIIGLGSAKSQAIYNNGATLEVSGTAYISAESSNRATITSINGGHTTITGGTIISENQSAVSNTKIINQDTVGDVIIVGTEDGNVDITTPVIQGYVYGIQSSSSGIEFYDGIIKGYNKAVNNDNDILNIEDGYDVEDETEIIDGVTYKTKYLSQNNYVTFDGNGGTASQSRKYVDVGDQVGALPTATLQGHVFIGWFTDPVNGTQITENTLVTGYDIYYAHYLEALTIQYNANGGMVDTSSVEVLEGQTLGTMPTPIKSRSRFDGWFTDPTNGTQITASTPIMQSATLYAHWTTIDAARVNGTDYPTLQDAIDVVPTTGVQTVVELLCYDEENVVVAAGKNILFNFNRNTLKNEVTTATVIENRGEIRIQDGTITSSAGYATIDNYNKLYVSGGNIIGTGTRQAIYNNGGTVEISGTAYLRSENLGTDKERGTVHNTTSGTVRIKGGTIVALKINAIYNDKGTVTIGEDDGTVSTTSPVIQGAKNGIKNNNSNGILYFYDGIVKVPTAQTLISGTVSGKPTGYDFVNGTETIDGASYKTCYLDVTP